MRWLLLVCLSFLLVGNWACSSEEKEAEAEAAETTAAVDAAQAMLEGDKPVRQLHSAVPKMNVNMASREDLGTIPGVGDKMVHEFEEYRPYVSIREFRQQIGKYVDDEQVAAYETFLYVPIDVNESDSETLQQLPGVTSKIAAELEAKRPFSTNAAFLRELAQHVSDPEARAGAALLRTR